MNVELEIKTDHPIPLRSRTIIHIILVHNKINEQLGRALKPFGVSLQQFNVLRILRGQKGKPANLSTLNERMVTKMSNTTRLVDKLLSRGYVEREVCESNRRKVEISITPKGSKMLLKMDEVMRKTEAELLGDLPENELEQLNSLLNKF